MLIKVSLLLAVLVCWLAFPSYVMGQDGKPAGDGGVTEAESAAAEESVSAEGAWSSQISYGIYVTYNTKCIWRGMNWVDDPVFQPDFWVSYRGLTFNVWANMQTTDYGEALGYGDSRGEFTEIDYTLYYTRQLGRLTGSVGLARYTYPHTGYGSTSEVYAVLAGHVLFQPSLSVFYDFDQADGFYTSLGLGHSFPLGRLGEGVSARLCASTSVAMASSNYNELYFGVDETTLTDFMVSVSMPVAMGERVTVSPSAGYSALIDGRLRESVHKEDNFWSGITISFGFW